MYKTLELRLQQISVIASSLYVYTVKIKLKNTRKARILHDSDN